ncbi:uncharacterized protein LOC107469515 isoform X4 [Arachis duranensis]|uniref:Pachytene checkpoint protein 2 homolog n=1 Tax=Arachis duranensis TaxID=130453 RepID=A0A9C6TMJ6_ARADU|nr:uncharacterized protein LOC107469515 isoform X1 [Arachis duranensis]XP_052111074.1 uncharacterized protein LOC107469515 isoform X4 [Arachis duranensis]
MVVGVFLAVTVAVVEAHRRRCERRSLLALLLGVWREWPCSASASGFCKLLESSAAGNQHWSCPKLVLCSLLKRVLIHIPCFMESGPWIGKISLCKALAQKLSIRFNSRFPQCQLIEVNAHSLLSKWFSENGKLVAKLFQKIQEMCVVMQMKSKALLRPEKLLYPVQILHILFGL